MLPAFGQVYGQKASLKDDKFETVSIKTSAICSMCKERLEKNLAFEKGVRSVSLDDKTKVITIEYRKGRNNKENLKKAISKIGYDADDLPADQKAHDRLPACCQKGNEPH
jgi:cation transport ATPase